MFSYGMNTSIQGMRARCPLARRLGKAVLNGYRFDFHHHADVSPDLDSDVHGLLWQLDEESLGHIDMVEGYPTYYEREEVWVDCDDGNQYLAWVYYMATEGDFDMPDEGYLSVVHQGYVENGIPVKQLWTALERCLRYG